VVRGELRHHLRSKTHIPDENAIASIVADWQANPSLSYAADVLCAAVVEGVEPLAREVALMIVRQKDRSEALDSLARDVLSGGTRGLDAQGLPRHPERTPDPGSLIREIKVRTAHDPRSAIAWIERARLHAVLGQMRNASKCAEIALALAPTNRFVVRCASRFFLLVGDRDRALSVFPARDVVDADPWLIAAEIAISQAVGKTSRHMKAGRNALSSGRYAPRTISELASAIATIESESGSTRRSHKLWEVALAEPTENAIAQAAWASRAYGTMTVSPVVLDRSFEASAWEASRRGDWTTAIDRAENWQDDQPFSSRPAIFGSFICSRAVEDYKTSIAFAERALPANPDDFTLRNNLAFCLALDGQVEKAKIVMGRMDQGTLSKSDLLVFCATSGLIAFRAGDPLRGEQLYGESISLARRQDDQREIIAEIYLALEKLRCRRADAEGYRSAVLDRCGAKKYTETMSKPENMALLDRLRIAQLWFP